MRFGRHLKEVTVPGKEDDCVRYDALKAAIKTQLAARFDGEDEAVSRGVIPRLASILGWRRGRLLQPQSFF